MGNKLTNAIRSARADMWRDMFRRTLETESSALGEILLGLQIAVRDANGDGTAFRHERETIDDFLQKLGAVQDCELVEHYR